MNLDINLYNDIIARVARKIEAQQASSSASQDSSNPSPYDTFIDNSSMTDRLPRGAISSSGVQNPYLVSFGEDKEDKTAMFDLSKPEDREAYSDKLVEKFSKDLQAAKTPEDMRELFGKVGKEIIGDIQSGDVRPDGAGEDYSPENFDIDEANKLMGGIADDELGDLEASLDELRNEANNTNIDSPGEKSFLNELERQARIQKWELLKQQSLVNYLKATLAGIKSSQKLAASAQ
jgi:hypothetical protein